MVISYTYQGWTDFLKLYFIFSITDQFGQFDPCERHNLP